MFFPPVEKVPLVDSPKTNFFIPPHEMSIPMFFHTGGIGGVPPTSQKFVHCPHTPNLYYTPHTISQFHPLTKQLFSSYNPIKTLFLPVVIVPA